MSGWQMYCGKIYGWQNIWLGKISCLLSVMVGKIFFGPLSDSITLGCSMLGSNVGDPFMWHRCITYDAGGSVEVIRLVQYRTYKLVSITWGLVIPQQYSTRTSWCLRGGGQYIFSESFGFPPPQTKNAIFLVLPFKEISLRPELSSSPRFRIYNKQSTISSEREGRRTNGRKSSF